MLKSFYQQRPIKILSYNIHKGFSSGNNQFVLDKMRHAIRKIDPDFVCLQEVLGQHSQHHQNYDNWIGDAQFEYLADELWPHFAYGKNAIYQHGHHGNAILSKHPFSHWENNDVSRWSFSQRGILHGIVHGQLHILCVHFGLLRNERVHQTQELLNTLANIPDNLPIIIAGDFNDWRTATDRKLKQRSSLIEIFRALGKRPPRTFPAKLPLFALDRIYCKRLNVVKAERLDHPQWQSLSDHRPLYAELNLT